MEGFEPRIGIWKEGKVDEWIEAVVEEIEPEEINPQKLRTLNLDQDEALV